ncbi:MAG: hypothetical protein ABW352_24965 [Polyangiales bacterium]
MWKLSDLASKQTRARSSAGEDLADSSLLEAARNLLAAARARRAIIVLGLLLTSTSLSIGLTGDDYLQKLMVREQPGIEGLRHRDLNLYAFARGSEEMKGLINEGAAPWWAEPNLHFEFFRPLSSLTHQLDYRLWPEQPVVMHLHSLLWFGVLLWTVGLLYQRFIRTPWVAGFALLLYAIDDAHAAPVAWLANRNALIATALPVLGLLAHDRWRARGDRRAAWLAALWFALGFCAGEASVQVGAYLFAYACFLDSGSWRERARSLLPYLSLVVAWRVVYALGEYGVRGSSVYIDPVGDPLYFMQSALVRLPVLLLAQFGMPFSEFWDLLPVIAPSLQPLMLVFALFVVGFVGWLLWPMFKRDAMTRFWAVGTLLATIPACAAVPNDRLLTATGLGGAALVARFIAAVADHSFPRRGKAVSAAFAAAIAVHALFSPLVLPLRAKAVGGLEVLMGRADRSIASDPSIEGREVVLLNPPVDPMPIYFAGYREAQGIPRPHYLRWLATGVSELVVTRVDERTLNVHPTGGYLSNSSQWMLRDRRTRSFVGEKVELADCTFEVRSVTADARPLDVEVRFHEPLESAHFQWMQWGRHEYVPFRVPALGKSTTIPAVDMKSALLGLGLSDS